MTIRERILNKERSWTDILPLVFLQAILWMEAGGFLGQVVLKIDRWGSLFTDNISVAEDISEYMLSLGFCIAIVIALAVFKKNRKLLPGKTGILKGAGIGLASGIVLNTAIVAGAVATGNLGLSYGHFEMLTVIGYLLAVLCQAGGEELICRLFIMGKLRRRYKCPVVAILGNSIFFTILHLGNPGITVVSVISILIASILFSLVVFYTDNIWMAISMHTAWNFMQTIVFGLPNSGMPSPYSVMKVVKAADGFFYDTGFGVEGSWAAVIFMSLAAVVLIVLHGKREAKCR
jgi:membrane protease YdiL (CAAX protease family)